MKEAKCIGKNLILQIINVSPIRIIHPRVSQLPGTTFGALMRQAYTH